MHELMQNNFPEKQVEFVYEFNKFLYHNPITQITA